MGESENQEVYHAKTDWPNGKLNCIRLLRGDTKLKIHILEGF